MIEVDDESMWVLFILRLLIPTKGSNTNSMCILKFQMCTGYLNQPRAGVVERSLSCSLNYPGPSANCSYEYLQNFLVTGVANLKDSHSRF